MTPEPGKKFSTMCRQSKRPEAEDEIGDADAKLIFEIVAQHLPHHARDKFPDVLYEVLGPRLIVDVDTPCDAALLLDGTVSKHD